MSNDGTVFGHDKHLTGAAALQGAPDAGVPRHDSYLDECLGGYRLYGDDFTPMELAEWFQDEREGFADLGAKERSSYAYEYHALNEAHGFRHLPDRPFRHVLSIGGAYGDELIPMLRKVSRVTILEPSDRLAMTNIDGVPVEYVKPAVTGLMPFADATFELATCFGCLHHIPNVSTVLRELFRCLTPSGYAVLREPIVSMGDWRRPRPGLTKRERGIPLAVFRNIVSAAGFHIRRETLCVFPAIPRLGIAMGGYAYNSSIVVKLDRALSWLFASNYRYHSLSPTWFEKLKPLAVALVLQKPPLPGASGSAARGH